MKRAAFALLGPALLAAPVQAQEEAGQDGAALEQGLAGAIRGCALWVLEPSSWAEGSKPYLDAVGLGPVMGMVESVPDVALPPEGLRDGNIFWRINATPEAGYILVVSFRLPMCHITGGGGVDLEPAIERVLASADFLAHWTLAEDQSLVDMRSTVYLNKEEPRFSIQLSRAPAPGGRQDRVQLLATALFDLNATDDAEGSGPGQ